MPESKSFLESMAEGSRPESFGQEKFEYVRDGKKKYKIIVGVLVVVLLIMGIIGVTYATGRVKVPELVGKSIEEATAWAQKNKITLYAKNTYSFEDEENTILSQEIPVGETIKKGSGMSIQVSLGPDPEEVITFPDIKSMTTSEIEMWISENKLTGVNLETVNSDVVERDHVISYSFTDGSEDNFKRKNRVTINVSIGSAELSETVVVGNFSSMKVAEVLQWGSDNGVIINLVEDFDDYIPAGSIISQSVKNSTEIKRTDIITVVVSKGKPVIVPDLSLMTKEEANSWAKLNNVTLTILEEYSVSESMGSFYGQSISKGRSMKQGDEIKAFYSLGRVEVGNYIGKTKLDMLTWQNEVNEKGASISLRFTETYGEKGTAGKIISQSIKNDTINIGSTINVVVSKGMKIATPDFNGKTEAECATIGKDNGLTILFDYEFSDTVRKGYVISQSPARDTVITDADPITIVISLTGLPSDQVVVPDFSSMKASAILQWGYDNGVSVNLIEVYNDFISSGSVVSQSITKNTVISKTENITVSISKGKAPAGVFVPSFVLMTKDEANAWSKSNNISLVILDRYSIYNKGLIYYQSAASGSSIDPGTTITLYYSLGRVEVANYIGKTKLDILNWQSNVNEKGAAVKIDFIENDTVEKGAPGIIIGQSIINDLVYPGTTIEVEISTK